MSKMIETHHEFTTSAAAWTFVRECEAAGLVAGCPKTAPYPQPRVTTVRVLRPVGA